MKTFVHNENVYNTRSAGEIVPIISEIIKPKSVIDVGCGLGTFLKVFKDEGAKRVLGLDGKWVDLSLLKKNISTSEFIVADLEKEININEQFDLAISLEVAEHISEDAADQFIRSLTKLSKVVLFSAAVPGQKGYGHINEQWPDYWRKKFASYDYDFYDVIRPLIWDNQNVFWWYKQNIFLAVQRNHLWPQEEFAAKCGNKTLNLVHPDLFQGRASVLDSLQYGEDNIAVYVKLFLKCILSRIGLYRKPKVIY